MGPLTSFNLDYGSSKGRMEERGKMEIGPFPFLSSLIMILCGGEVEEKKAAKRTGSFCVIAGYAVDVPFRISIVQRSFSSIGEENYDKLFFPI